MNWPVANRHTRRVVVLMMVATALILGRPEGRAQSRQSTAKAENAPAGKAPNGKKLYNSYGCYQCHGYDGQGGAGPRIGPNPISFPVFLRYTRRPAGQMPPYTSKVVSDSEMADIYAFLKALPQPPPAKSIPLLND